MIVDRRHGQTSKNTAVINEQGEGTRASLLMILKSDAGNKVAFCCAGSFAFFYTLLFKEDISQEK